MPIKWLQERPNGSKNDLRMPPRRALCGPSQREPAVDDGGDLSLPHEARHHKKLSREGERNRERQRERQRERERESDRARESERNRGRERQTQRERQRERERATTWAPSRWSVPPATLWASYNSCGSGRTFMERKFQIRTVFRVHLRFSWYKF